MGSRLARHTATILIALAAVCSLDPASVAHARPVVIEETSAISSPDSSWEHFGRYVAVDGDWALVQGDRFIPDETSESGVRHDAVAMLFQNVGGVWTFVRTLGAVEVLDEWTHPGLAMKHGVAVVVLNSSHVFERTGAAWAEAPIELPAFGLQGPDIEVENGRILAGLRSCEWDSRVYSKNGGIWTVEGSLEGHSTGECGDNLITPSQDLDGARAVVFNSQGGNEELPVARLYRPNTAGGAGWEEFVTLPAPPFATRYGQEVALQGAYVAATGSPESGTWLVRENNNSWGWPVGVMRPVDSYMQPGPYSTTTLEHGNGFFFTRNFSHDRNAYVVNVFRASGADVEHVATLAGKQGASLGRSVDVSGNRVIVGGDDHYGEGDNVVRIFELPATFAPAAVRQDDFEQSGAGADWQPIAGSAFSVVQSGNTRVYRQTSVAGDAGSFLPASEATAQAIQAEVTPRSFSGSDRWFGLATRQTDLNNYYYVTARSSNRIQLKRMLNGAFVTLASASYPIAVGRKYRLRLESIGARHRVYVDDKVLLTAYDSSLEHGRAGVLMYRASADYDNVVVSPSAFATVYAQSFPDEQPGRWTNLGVWSAAGGVYRQTWLEGDARAITGAAADDLIVQARVRPTSFNGANRWVGLFARYTDERNHLYVTLRNSNTLSLRQLVNGQIQVLSEQPITVTPGTWYTLRLETIGATARVYVNGSLRLSAGNVAPTSGQVGLAMYKAAAEFDDFLAYQP